ncbi:MAG: aromatic ring-opening dioxygenase LigA [Ornithinibacter sp.]
MSDTKTRSPNATTGATDGTGFVKIAGWIVAAIGAVMLVAGGGTWLLVQNQLSAENITVTQDARWFAGDQVNGPFTAYSQADIINTHALEGSGGKTYAELDRDDPARASVMNGSFLRASLFTSVLAFGVSFMAMGLGLVQMLLGLSMTKVAGLLSHPTRA